MPSPQVALCMVSALDGNVVSPGLSIPSFSTREDRHRLFELRARSDLLISGAGTLRREELQPLVRCEKWTKWRTEKGLGPHPDVLIISGSGNVPLHSPYFSCEQTFHIVSHNHSSKTLPEYIHWHQVSWPIDLRGILQQFRKKGYEKMLLEGGPRLANTFFQDNLIDDIYLTLSAVVFGGCGEKGISFGELLPIPLNFQIADVKHNERDVFIHCVRA